MKNKIYYLIGGALILVTVGISIALSNRATTYQDKDPGTLLNIQLQLEKEIKNLTEQKVMIQGIRDSKVAEARNNTGTFTKPQAK